MAAKKRLIRCRHFENELHEREEILFVMEDLTDMVNEQEIYLGITEKDAKPLEISAYAD